MPLTIRPYQTQDWPSICQIHDAARPDELIGSCDPHAFVPLEKDQEVAHLKLCQKMVAVLDENVVGFIGVHEGYLGWLYIHPAHYEQGFGRKLLQSSLKLISGKAWTIVLAGNIRAINLYKSEGFIEVNKYESNNAGYPCTCLKLERKS